MDKERSNFCDYFRLNTRVAASGSNGASGNDGTSHRDRFDALFS